MAQLISRSFACLCALAAIGVAVECARSFFRCDEAAYFSYRLPMPPARYRDFRIVIGSFRGGVFVLNTEADLDGYVDWCGGAPTEAIVTSGGRPELAAAALTTVANSELPAPRWRRAGFWGRASKALSPGLRNFHAVVVPDWVPFFLLALPAAVHFRRLRQRRWRERRGQCVECGYDLRASGRQCPECGHARNTVAASSSGKWRRLAWAGVVTAAMVAILIVLRQRSCQENWATDTFLPFDSTGSSSNRQPSPRVELELKPGLGIRFALIPSGSFVMGSPEGERGRRWDEQQPHPVTLSNAFYMAVTTVTQEQYEAVMVENPSEWRGPHQPAENVSWDDAVEFCRRVSKGHRCSLRLPTEAEWEYACRAGTSTPFNTGNLLTRDMADYNASGSYPSDRTGRAAAGPMEVASFPPNAWGLYDMHGGVYQWCADTIHPDPSDLVDPSHPERAIMHPTRGGSCWQVPSYCRSAVRLTFVPGRRSHTCGFRACMDAVDRQPSTDEAR